MACMEAPGSLREEDGRGEGVEEGGGGGGEGR